MTVVPGDEFGRGVTAGKVFARDFQSPVRRGACRIHHRMVVVEQLRMSDVDADLDMEKIAKTGLVLDLTKQTVDGLRPLVIRGNTGSHQTVRRRQFLEDVHVDARLFEELVGCIQGGRTRTHNRDPPPPSSLGHFDDRGNGRLDWVNPGFDVELRVDVNERQLRGCDFRARHGGQPFQPCEESATGGSLR